MPMSLFVPPLVPYSLSDAFTRRAARAMRGSCSGFRSEIEQAFSLNLALAPSPGHWSPD
jgi:hypothetical protein